MRLLPAALGEEPEWEECGTCDNCRGKAIRAVGCRRRCRLSDLVQQIGGERGSAVQRAGFRHHLHQH